MADATAPTEAARGARAARLLVLLLACSLPIGLLFTLSGLVTAGPDANAYLATLHLFVAQDMWAGPIIAALVVAAMAFAARAAPVARAVPDWGVAAVAVASAAAVFALRFTALHNFNFTMDEFFPHFQAEILRHGQLLAPMSDEAFAQRASLQPFFTYVDADHQLWSQHYRPVHAAILSLFPRGYEAAIAHALLTATTVLAMASIARRLFPDRPGAPLLAACLLAASPQVLLTGASGFAFTAHLAFNTVWLALFLRGTWPAHIAAAALSFLALGLHQVHVHAIYAFPFGIALLLGCFGNRWKAVPYIVAAAVGVPFWIAWPEIATWLQTGDAASLPRSLMEVEYLSNYIGRSAASVGQMDRQFSLIFLFVNIWRFALWMSPALVLLVVLAALSPSGLGRVPVIAGLGVIFGIAVSHLMLPNQTFTIGSRYYHPFIGSLVVVALAAYYAVTDDPRFRRATVALVAAGAVLLPWRAWQMHEQVAPRAAIQAQLEAMPVESIVIAPGPVWFGFDFVRNDPYLRNRPVFYAAPQGATVTPMGDGESIVVTGQDIVGMGLPVGTYLEPDFAP